MRTWALVTGRMNSTRLPGKTMAAIHGAPSLQWICERAAAARVDGVVVATSGLAGDEPIRAWARARGLPCFGGSLDNVLERTLGAAALVQAERVVFVNGDSPLTDPLIVNDALARHDVGDCDYVSSLHGGGGYPDGFSAEVFTLAALRASARDDPRAQEHVTTVFYEGQPRTRVATLTPALPPPPGLHLSLDTADDLSLIADIYAEFLPGERLFGYQQVVELLNARPDLCTRAQLLKA